MAEFYKYVRTPHIKGSRFQHGDHDLEAVPWTDLSKKHLVVEEKVDGANVGISFDVDGNLFLQSRGHYLKGGPREKQFEIFKQWAICHQESLYCTLGSRYVLYGEWMAAKHTIFYDALPHYFMEFDVLDTITNTFLDTTSRKHLLRDLKIVSVRVLYTGIVDDIKTLSNMIGPSAFFSIDSDQRQNKFLVEAVKCGFISSLSNDDSCYALKTGDWSPMMEGLYIKWEEDGIVKGRYKYVRESFTNSIIDQEMHWMKRPIVKNLLLPGAYDKMFLV